MSDAKKSRSEAGSSGIGSHRASSRSVVIDAGRRESKCGYCKSGARTSISHGLWAYNLTVDDYQALLDRGWRRSGCYLYQPEMEKTCCPSYTIRLKVSEFMPSREQDRVFKRMQRFLDGKLTGSNLDKLCELEASTSNIHDKNVNLATESKVVDSDSKNKDEQFTLYLSDQINDAVQKFSEDVKFSSDIRFPKASVKKVIPAKQKLQAKESEVLVYTCNISFQVAATLRQMQKDADKNRPVEHVFGSNKCMAELSTESIAENLVTLLKQQVESTCDLNIRSLNGHINFYSAREESCYSEGFGSKTMSEPSSVTSKSKERHAKESSGGPQGQIRRLEVRLKISSFDYDEYCLYRKYQIRVHNDTLDHVSESSYKRFLVDTPLVHVPQSDDKAAPPCGFGSFHQQYLVDGKLIAVGVIDILPNCLSSKYFFWDPDLPFLSLGKFSTLEEIRWVNENRMHCPSLQYYYLGYYIHSCSKMLYKAAYRPSELLCPLRYRWVPYDISKPLLDRRKYVVLSDFEALQNGDSLPPNAVDNLMEEQQNDFNRDTLNDAFVNSDDMDEMDSENSVDDESDSITSMSEFEDVDLSEVLIGHRGGAQLRYKNMKFALDTNKRNFIELRLQRYVRLVGTELSEQMVYSF